MQQTPDKSSHTFEPSGNKHHPAAGIGQLESIPVPDNSNTRFCDKYTWMAYFADEPIEYDIFDTRAQNAFRRNNYSTWGHLGTLTDEVLYKMPYIGNLTVDRINEALETFQPTNFRYSQKGDESEKIPPDPRTYIAIEWNRAVTDDDTLGGLLEAFRNGNDVPPEISEAIDIILDTPIPKLTGHRVPLLSDRIDELVAEAGDSELFVIRECSRHKPTLEELGASRNLTRERIRQIVARDSKFIREALSAERFQCVRWAADRLRAEVGVLIQSDHDDIKRWTGRLGERRFEVLRWVAGYIYENDVLVLGKHALSELKQALNTVVGNKWLIETKDLISSLDIAVRPEIALSFLFETGQWRDIGDGWLLRWDGAIQHKAERVLRLTCQPMTPDELIDAIGHGSVGSLKNQHGSTLIRVDKEFRLALREWGYEEYEGITTEIGQRIDRGGGVASVSAILEEFVSAFGVKEGSVRAYLEAGPYIISGDEVRHLANRGYTPSSVSGRRHAIRIGDKWGQRFTVSDANMRGYSFDLDRDIAAHNGLQPEDSLVVPAKFADTIVGEASLIWRLTYLRGTVDVGRLSSVLRGLGIGAGDEIIIVASPESCTVLRDSETPQHRRSAVSDDIRRSLLGRQ